jgi:hypothetical protein
LAGLTVKTRVGDGVDLHGAGLSYSLNNPVVGVGAFQ